MNEMYGTGVLDTALESVNDQAGIPVGKVCSVIEGWLKGAPHQLRAVQWCRPRVQEKLGIELFGVLGSFLQGRASLEATHFIYNKYTPVI
jgi:hypothetical protein